MKAIEVDDYVFAEALEFATRSGRTVSAVTEDALRAVLPSSGERFKKGRVKLPVHGDGGLQPGVDLDNTAALWDLMDASHAAS